MNKFKTKKCATMVKKSILLNRNKLGRLNEVSFDIIDSRKCWAMKGEKYWQSSDKGSHCDNKPSMHNSVINALAYVTVSYSTRTVSMYRQACGTGLTWPQEPQQYTHRKLTRDMLMHGSAHLQQSDAATS